jgi:hypothetical protein
MRLGHRATLKQMVRWSGVVSLVPLLAGCASTPDHEAYFKRHLNEVNYDAVAKRFGPPHQSRELTTGETIWAYQYRNGSCTDYVLTFDQAKVLRDWKEHEC